MTIGVLWVLLAMAVTSALSAVFKVALYRYARGEQVDPEFRPSDLTNAFTPAPPVTRPRRGGVTRRRGRPG